MKKFMFVQIVVCYIWKEHEHDDICTVCGASR